MMIDFQISRKTNQYRKKPTNRYIKRYGNGMSYTIGGKQGIDKMQRNLMV